MQEAISGAENKLEFIYAFQKGFYKLCKRVDPEDPVKFVINQLSRIFYATKNIRNMKSNIDDDYIDTYNYHRNYYDLEVFNFDRNISFMYTLSEYEDIGFYKNGYVFECDLPILSVPPREFMGEELFDDPHDTDNICDEDFDSKKYTFYVSFRKDSEGAMYFPINVSRYQATMDVHGFSKMISLASLFMLYLIHMVSEVCEEYAPRKIDKAQFYRILFENDNIICPDITRIDGFKYWLDTTDINDTIRSLCTLNKSILDDLNTDDDLQVTSKEVTFSTLPDASNDKDEEDNGRIINVRKNKPGKQGTTVAVKIPDSMADSPISELSSFLGNLLGLDLDDMIEEDGDDEDNKTDKSHEHPTIDSIIEFIDLLDEPISFIDISVTDAKEIVKAMNKYLSTNRCSRPTITSHPHIQKIYESAETVICFKAEQSELDIITFVLAKMDGEYTMYKCNVPGGKVSRNKGVYPAIAIAMNGVGTVLELRKTNMYYALKNIQDIDDFHDDCLRILMAWFGRYATKKANVTNPYRGVDKDNNIVIENANFSSVISAFEKIDLFNDEYEIDAAIKFFKKESRAHEFITPWMKEIKDTEDYPVIVDTDGAYYAYEHNGKRFTKLVSKGVVPSSPFHTDVTFQISKGNKSITAKGAYLATSGFKSDIVSIFNYLKQLKKMD